MTQNHAIKKMLKTNKLYIRSGKYWIEQKISHITWSEDTGVTIVYECGRVSLETIIKKYKVKYKL